jgi:hypothetical protein
MRATKTFLYIFMLCLVHTTSSYAAGTTCTVANIEPRLSISHFSWIWGKLWAFALALGARSVLMDTIRESDCVSVG